MISCDELGLVLQYSDNAIAVEMGIAGRLQLNRRRAALLFSAEFP